MTRNIVGLGARKWFRDLVRFPISFAMIGTMLFSCQPERSFLSCEAAFSTTSTLLYHSYDFPRLTERTVLRAQKPQRCPGNAPGVLYVNDKCINCSACSHFAPDTFERHGSNHHVVYQQPETTTQIEKARAALAACPVAAIRLETKASRSHSSAIKDNVQWSSQDEYLAQALSLRRPSTATSSTETQTYPFPRPVISQDNTLYFLGHHNEASFGATPYLLSAVHEGKPVWIMIDTPKYSSQAVQTLERILGNHEPDFLFLTHVDDTADHQKWKDHYPGLKRIFHEGDLGVHNWIGDLSLENVEVLLKFEEQVEQPYLPMYTLDGDAIRETDLVTLDSNVVILHTPGHSPGSITLYRLPEKRSGTSGILFTGDTYAFSTRTNKMSGFPRYGHDLHQQATTLQALLRFDWEFVAPGHGHCRDYIGKHNEFREAEIQDAIEELLDQ